MNAILKIHHHSGRIQTHHVYSEQDVIEYAESKKFAYIVQDENDVIEGSGYEEGDEIPDDLALVRQHGQIVTTNALGDLDDYPLSTWPSEYEAALAYLRQDVRLLEIVEVEDA